MIDSLGLSEAAIARVAAKEEEELARRELAYRGERPPLNLTA